MRASQKRITFSSIPPKTLIFLPSPLLFYGYKKLRSMIDGSCHILAIEADEKLMALSISSIDAKIINDPSLTYVRADNPEIVETLIADLGIWRFRCVISVKLNGGYRLHTQFYRDVELNADQTIRGYWQNRMTKIHMEPLWIKNLFTNLCHLAMTADFSSLQTEKPIVVAGAGESIEKNIPLILSIRDRVLVLAVDTALPVLTGLGLKPDYVVALEAQHANLNDFLGSSADVNLIWDLTSYPAAVRLFPSRYAMATEFDSTRILERLSQKGLLPCLVPPLGSVGVTALYLALTMTNAPVFIAGLDFSYVPGKTHARGAPAHARLLNSLSRIQPSSVIGLSESNTAISGEGKDGRRYVSDIVLNGYGKRMAEIADQSGRVFDIANEGLFYGGRRLSTESAVKDVIKGCTQDAQEHNEPTQSFDREQIVEFIADEIRFLERALHAAESYQNGAYSYEQAKDTLEDVDYVYAHFPENPPFPKPDPSFMRRFIISARGYAAVAARAQKELAN